MDRVKSVRTFAAKAVPARLRHLCLLVAPLVLLAAVPTEAKTLATTTFKVTVTVVEPPKCVINENRPIEVNFGEVMTNRIDGSNYRVPITYGLDCNGAKGAKLALTVSGTAASFDKAALRTSVDGLGIRLYTGDELLKVNDGTFKFNYPAKPKLFAVPVRKTSAQLHGGEFTAAATLKVEYL